MASRRIQALLEVEVSPRTSADPVAFAQIYAFDLTRLPHLGDWPERVTALPGFQSPFDLLQLQDAELP